MNHMIKFFQTKDKLSDKEIKEFEREFNISLPSEYRNHLLEFNGGKCRPNYFSFIENGKLSENSVEWFLAIWSGETINLKNFCEILKTDSKRMPSMIFPIATDGSGNFICISCGGKDIGYIYFWDHENEVDYSISCDNDYSNLHLIAKSFNDFLNLLADE